MSSTDLTAWPALFEPADPPRLGQVLFYRPNVLAAVPDDPPEGAEYLPRRQVSVVRQQGARVTGQMVPFWSMSVDAALPVLTRARLEGSGDESCRFWGAASLFALELISRGRIDIGVTESGFDTWRCSPGTDEERSRFVELAEAMPPTAHALDVRELHIGRPAMPDPRFLLQAYLDAVADGMARTPDAPQRTGSPVFTALPLQHVPQLALHAAPAAVPLARISLLVEIDEDGPSGVRAVLQVRRTGPDKALLGAAQLWGEDADPGLDHVRLHATVALHAAAEVWPPLKEFLDHPGLDGLDLFAEEIDDLLGEPATALAAAGCDVLLPRDVVKALTATAVLSTRSPVSAMPGGLLGQDQLLDFQWRVALGGRALTASEMNRLAEAQRPFIRLRDRWVRVDAALAAKLRRRRGAGLTGIEGLAAAITGTVDGPDGEVVGLAPVGGWLARLREVLTQARDGKADIPASLNATLRPYQEVGLAWLQQLTGAELGAVLADDMGLGKTLQLIALHLSRQEHPDTAGPALIVCPATLLGSWTAELGRFAPHIPVHRVHGSAQLPERLPEDAVVLTTYTTLHRRLDTLSSRRWALQVLDEAQLAKNPHTQVSKAVRAVDAQARVALTGTPVENKLADLKSIFDYAVPGLLGTDASFRARYARPIESEGDEVAAARLRALTGPFVLRRLKSDPEIAPDLPPKIEQDRPVDLTTEQVALYEAVVREHLAAIADSEGIARHGLVFKLLTTLRQICLHPALYLDDKDSAVGRSFAERSGKVALLDELLDVIIPEGQAVLVFTQYVRMAELLAGHLAARGIGHDLLHGKLTAKARTAMVERFQAGQFPVFLLSLRAAGTGLTLTRAGHVVQLDQWYNPAVMDQAADRAYRIGQTQTVQVHRLVATGTMEDAVMKVLADKRRLADLVLSRGEAGLSDLTDQQLADLVTLRRN
ncbi:DEAD/DEAH box helicase (plasmid) [Kitasatospora sp. NBC_00374]|uniref:DEAD/DEAH box helicase n=1 Tax=Kitasatospora sp. NBC_00374 TaxID=2975964 RepID=UPI002F90F487